MSRRNGGCPDGIKSERRRKTMSQSNESDSLALQGNGPWSAVSRTCGGVLLAIVVGLGAGYGLANARTVDAQPADGLVVHEELRAKAFHLVDDDGKIAAQLIIDEEAGGAVLRFFDSNQVRRLDLGLAEGQRPALQFADEKGRPRMFLALDAASNPQLVMADREGNRLATYGVTPAQDAYIAFTDGAEFVGLEMNKGDLAIRSHRWKGGRQGIAFVMEDGTPKLETRELPPLRLVPEKED